MLFVRAHTNIQMCKHKYLHTKSVCVCVYVCACLLVKILSIGFLCKYSVLGRYAKRIKLFSSTAQQFLCAFVLLLSAFFVLFSFLFLPRSCNFIFVFLLLWLFFLFCFSFIFMLLSISCGTVQFALTVALAVCHCYRYCKLTSIQFSCFCFSCVAFCSLFHDLNWNSLQLFLWRYFRKFHNFPIVFIFNYARRCSFTSTHTHTLAVIWGSLSTNGATCCKIFSFSL